MERIRERLVSMVRMLYPHQPRDSIAATVERITRMAPNWLEDPAHVAMAFHTVVSAHGLTGHLWVLETPAVRIPQSTFSSEELQSLQQCSEIHTTGYLFASLSSHFKLLTPHGKGFQRTIHIALDSDTFEVVARGRLYVEWFNCRGDDSDVCSTMQTILHECFSHGCVPSSRGPTLRLPLECSINYWRSFRTKMVTLSIPVVTLSQVTQEMKRRESEDVRHSFAFPLETPMQPETPSTMLCPFDTSFTMPEFGARYRGGIFRTHLYDHDYTRQFLDFIRDAGGATMNLIVVDGDDIPRVVQTCADMLSHVWWTSSQARVGTRRLPPDLSSGTFVVPLKLMSLCRVLRAWILSIHWHRVFLDDVLGDVSVLRSMRITNLWVGLRMAARGFAFGMVRNFFLPDYFHRARYDQIGTLLCQMHLSFPDVPPIGLTLAMIPADVNPIVPMSSERFYHLTRAQCRIVLQRLYETQAGLHRSRSVMEDMVALFSDPSGSRVTLPDWDSIGPCQEAEQALDACPICTLPPTQPVRNRACSHVFCHGCLREWNAIKSNCPCCRTAFQSEFVRVLTLEPRASKRTRTEAEEGDMIRARMEALDQIYSQYAPQGKVLFLSFFQSVLNSLSARWSGKEGLLDMRHIPANGKWDSILASRSILAPASMARFFSHFPCITHVVLLDHHTFDMTVYEDLCLRFPTQVQRVFVSAPRSLGVLFHRLIFSAMARSTTAERTHIFSAPHFFAPSDSLLEYLCGEV